MRPIRRTVAAAGTYYFPVNRYTDNTVVTVDLTTLTITSVDYTIDNVRVGAKTGGNPRNLPDNGVAVGDAMWVAITAGATGEYVANHTVDTIRVVLAGTGSANITVGQDTVRGAGGGG